MITQTETIDESNPLAKIQFDRAVKKWRSECIKSVVSSKSWKKIGRTLRRELERRGCKVDSQKNDDTMIMTFIDKGKIKGRLIIMIENTEPEPVKS